MAPRRVGATGPPPPTLSATSPTTVETFLAELPLERQPVVRALRRVILRTVPTAGERVYAGWRAIGYRHSIQGYFCGMFPYEARVLLVFEWGVLLPDPHNLLTGAGRQARVIRLDTNSRVPVRPIA